MGRQPRTAVMEWSQSEPGDKLPVLWVDAHDPWGSPQVIQESQKSDAEPPTGGLWFSFDSNATVSWFFLE